MDDGYNDSRQQQEDEQRRYEEEMNNTDDDIWQLLADPFDPKLVKWRVGSTSGARGTALAYVDARVVMQRLDDVVGPENWQDDYQDLGNGRLLCRLSIRVNGDWITKSDGAGDTNVEGEKGGISDAFKRAAVKFGVSRYLYSLPTTWVDLDGKRLPKNFNPTLPAWAMPKFKRYSITEDYIAALRDNLGTLNAVKSALDEYEITGHAEHLSEAAQAWYELDQDTQQMLYKAPSKGGMFTTKQRSIIASSEFRKAHFGE